MLISIAVRNLAASRTSLLIGGMIFVVSALLVIGTSVLDAIELSLQRTIRNSAAGDIQLYSSRSTEDLALWSAAHDESALSPVADFAAVRALLGPIAGISAVIPMGIHNAEVAPENALDRIFHRLRERLRQVEQAGTALAEDAQAARLLALAQANVRRLRDHLATPVSMLDEAARSEEEREALERAVGEPFWAGFHADPYGALEFLENWIAPQMAEGEMIYLRYLGTDLEAFSKAFDRFVVVDGQAVPTGGRGLLLSKYAYENQLKLKTALRLDKLRAAATGGRLISGDPELQQWVRDNQLQTQEILVQLDDAAAAELTASLQAKLGSQGADLGALLVELFQLDDQNLEERAAFFYAEIAPMLQLYLVPVGQEITLRSFTRTGAVRSASLTLYGTYQFSGLERSELSGMMNLVDLTSFRHLYGEPTGEDLSEMAGLVRPGEVAEVSREELEALLFSGDASVVERTPSPEVRPLPAVERETAAARTIHPDDHRQGMVLNVAVLLSRPAEREAILAQIVEAIDRSGLELKAVPGEHAAGELGQFVAIARALLLFGLALVLLATAAVLTNSMMLATLQRIRELGTLRAIGAHRSMLLGLVVLETTILALFFGGLGVAASLLLFAGLGSGGIPSVNDFTSFLFSGDRLLPVVGGGPVLLALGAVLAVSLLSALYPAVEASRVPPIQAIQTED